ncbi:MAG: HAMP domain-containing protein [Bacteroidetes bacterium]|nr:HAMP domain-containing protein [Bacteroidota bacterium]
MLLTLRSKILAGYAVLAVLMAALGGYMVMSFRTFTGVSSQAYERISNADRANLAIYESLVRINDAAVRSFGENVPLSSTVFSDEPPRINAELSSAEKIIASIPTDIAPTLAPAFTRLEVLWHQYQAQLPEFTKRILDSPTEARKFYSGVLLPTYTELTITSREVSAMMQGLFETTRRLTEQESQDASQTVIIVTLAAIALGIVVGFAIVRATTRPLRTLSDSLKRIQAGDLGVHLDVTGADELGEVSFEFNRMAERLDRYDKLNVERLMDEKSKSEAVILALDEPLFLLDSTGRVLVTNRSAERLLAKTEDAIIGQELIRLFTDEETVRIIRSSVSETPAPASKPPLIEARVGTTTRFYRVSSTRIVSKAAASPTKLGSLVHFSDVTQFEELDRLKDDFLAKVSHEFRTPLTSIKMALDILAKSKIGALTDDQRELVLTSKMDTERLSKLIKDLLTMTRLRQGSEEQRELVNVAEVATDVLRSIEPQASAKSVSIKKLMSQGIAAVFSRTQLESLVQNLVGNALAHTPEGGTITVEVLARPEGGWSLAVSDTGSGIAAADLERIFERFVQLKPKDVATPGSVGLGLSIVKDIVDSNAGTITVTSTLGSGSTFVAVFPKTFNEQA